MCPHAGNRCSGLRETGTRDDTSDAFAAGIVLHAGPHVFPVSDRLIAAPVSALWS